MYFDSHGEETTEPCHLCGEFDESSGIAEHLEEMVTSREVIDKVESIHDIDTYEAIPVDSQLGQRIISEVENQDCQPTCEKCDLEFIDMMIENAEDEASQPLSEGDIEKLEEAEIIPQPPDPDQPWSADLLDK